jgi:hypothetical protein
VTTAPETAECGALLASACSKHAFRRETKTVRSWSADKAMPGGRTPFHGNSLSVPNGPTVRQAEYRKVTRSTSGGRQARASARSDHIRSSGHEEATAISLSPSSAQWRMQRAASRFGLCMNTMPCTKLNRATTVRMTAPVCDGLAGLQRVAKPLGNNQNRRTGLSWW